MDFSKINLADNQKLARLIIISASSRNFKNRSEFERFRNRIIKQHKGRIFHNLYFIKAYNDLIKEGKIKPDNSLLNLIQKRSVRTMSGVAPVTVMTKPYPCPGRCIYCPNDVRMPKSYLPSQPAAQRAFRQRFDPYTQVFVRLKALLITGHEVSKVELRVIGGSWNAYSKKYQTWFLKRCLIAMNEFYQQIGQGRADDMSKITKKQVIKSSYGIDFVNTVFIRSLSGNKKWSDVVKENERARVRCIGINIETRPDLIDKKEIKRMRYLGITKVEMGVQTTDEKIQKITKRGHTLKDVKEATKLLKDSGFKVGYHMMPNLPGSSVEFDKKMVGQLFKNSEFQPDYLKIYPCVVMPKTKLFDMYSKGNYKSYDDSTLEEVLFEEMKSVPEWCRIDRVARDISSDEVISGFRVSNIRQILEEKLKKDGTPCRDIRSREIRNFDIFPENIEFVARSYDASGGKEMFLSYEDVKNDKLIALLRLRFPGKVFISELKDSTLVREVHVYGKQIPVGGHSKNEKQHMGWGSKLLNKAEELTKKAGYKYVAVISGIGTRQYYSKNGYHLNGTYMLKNILVDSA